MTIERTAQGIRIYALTDDGDYVSQLYNGYTVAEAKRKFKQLLAEKAKSF